MSLDREHLRRELLDVSTEILKAILVRGQGSSGLGYTQAPGKTMMATHVRQAVNAAELLIADVDDHSACLRGLKRGAE